MATSKWESHWSRSRSGSSCGWTTSHFSHKKKLIASRCNKRTSWKCLSATFQIRRGKPRAKFRYPTGEQIIVHSKKTDHWSVFDFFQMFWKIFQFSLFQCLKNAFVLLSFQFQVYSTLGKQFYFFRAKISGFAFSTTSKRSLQVCVVHVPILPSACKGQSDDFAL